MSATVCIEPSSPGRVDHGAARSTPDRRGAPPASCLYACRVLHHRIVPREHRFVYRLFYLCLDLDEMSSPGLHPRLLAYDRPGVFSLYQRDFLRIDEPLHRRTTSPVLADRASAPHDAGGGLKARVRAFCAAHGVPLAADARVRLVTLPRVFGYHFNPVSFYFCADSDGTPRAAIAEVTNTFREIKPYFVPLGPDANATPNFRLRVPKHFYVSPFSAVDMDFDFNLRAPDRALAVQIDDYEAGQRVLHSTLTGERMELSDTRLAWYLVKYPLMSLGVIARIHWQAWRLWRKGVPFFRKAEAAGRQRDLYRPHRSLSDQSSP